MSRTTLSCLRCSAFLHESSCTTLLFSALMLTNIGVSCQLVDLRPVLVCQLKGAVQVLVACHPLRLHGGAEHGEAVAHIQPGIIGIGVNGCRQASAEISAVTHPQQAAVRSGREMV